MSKVVLVTGITGFVGTHVTLEFLKAGYRVRGTARSAGKAEEWIARFPEYKDGFEYAVVGDVAADDAFTEAVKGVNFVVHTASPFHMNIKDNEKDMLIPAINGTLNILRATKLEPKIEHVVVTSSLAAIMDLKLGVAVGKTYTSDDWNPATYEEAKNSDNPTFVYCASKKLAEKALWDYVRDEKPSWSATAIAPPYIFGPPIQPVSSLEGIGTSSQSILGLIDGSHAMEVPPTSFPVWVDVRDVALAHLRAVEKPAAKNSRYILVAGHFSNDQVVAFIRNSHPELACKLPLTDGRAPESHFSTDSSKAVVELGIKFIGFEKCINDTVDELLRRMEEFGGNEKTKQ